MDASFSFPLYVDFLDLFYFISPSPATAAFFFFFSQLQLGQNNKENKEEKN